MSQTSPGRLAGRISTATTTATISPSVVALGTLLAMLATWYGVSTVMLVREVNGTNSAMPATAAPANAVTASTPSPTLGTARRYSLKTPSSWDVAADAG